MRAGVGREVVTAVLVAGMVGLGAGFGVPLVSLRLDEAGASATAVGVVGAFPAVGFVLAAPFSATLLRLLGGRGVLTGAMLLTAATTACLALDLPVGALAPVRLVAGAAAGVLVVLGEAWVNLVAPERSRGLVVAAYAVLYTVAQACGPVLVSVLGLWSAGAVLLVTVLQAAPVGLVLGTGCDLPRERVPVRAGLLPVLRGAPVVMTGMAAYAVLDGASSTLLPVFGTGHGMAGEVAPLLVTAVLVGDVLLQLPVGRAADRYPLDRLVLGCCGAVVLLCLTLTRVAGSLLLWPVLALLGGCFGAVFTLTMVRLGRDFHGRALVTASAATATVTGLGQAVGPAAAGRAIDALGPVGLPLCLGVAAVVLAGVVLAVRARAAAPVPEPVEGGPAAGALAA